MRKKLQALILVSICIIMVTNPIYASAESSVMSEEEVQEFLGVESALTDEEYDEIMDNMDYLLVAETDMELEQRIIEKGLEDSMEIVDDEYDTTINRQVRVGIPNSFSADFTNRSITSTMFSARLVFYNYLPQAITQCAGYVGYEYQSPSGNKLIIKPKYVNEVFMGPGVVRTVGKYSYQHNNRPAKYVASLVLNLGAGKAKVPFTVEEKKW